MSVALTTAVEELPGLTPRVAGLLRTLGLTNLGRLVAHLPTRHERLEAEATIDQLASGANISTRGEITATRPVFGKRPRFEAVLMDHTGRLDLVWFNGLYMRDKIHPGVRVRVQGKVTRRGPGLQAVNPKVEVLSAEGEEPPEHEAAWRPVYPASEQINSVAIWRAIKKVLPLALPLIEEHLPEAFRREREMPTLSEAYRMQHEPASEAEILGSRRRLAYDEFLLLQLGVHIRRAYLRERLRAPALKFSEGIDRHIRERLPFVLTPGQEGAVREIAADLSRATPANRLIQGDVGSGKTMVALYAMLMAVASERQASLMAPTEILAEQHYEGLSRILKGSRVRLALLTGGTPRPEREALLGKLAAGDVDVLIGTHALLTEDVKFKELAVAVIDEQHRFGVHQRARLRASATDETSTPHVLVMTATPIPRTLAITLFGDLDISVVRGLPPGRMPIETRGVSSERRRDAYEDVAERIARGEQAYVVVPAIEPGEAGAGGEPIRDVRTVLKELEEGYLKGVRLAALHGRLSRETREATMERFRVGEIKALVATTVIEVGVDVPNATAMVVEQADRFGLAQLHQLRGRVGRGTRPSACWLIADPVTPEGEQRLAVMCQTTDGFVLAEKDLEIRGPGEVFGTRQAGIAPFKVADLMRDRALLDMARRDAAAWIKRSPLLAYPEEAVLKRRLMKSYGETLGLADVG
ncbi:MAG: ATP-dependent DNA helicase RecG [Tepidisphaera sp.]|nr:ATP-dependent DNA helicase RecG [Tepidisphaera sp.]